jgi:hypothetical protein
MEGLKKLKGLKLSKLREGSESMWQAADQAYRFGYAKFDAVIESETGGCCPFAFEVSRLLLACSHTLDRRSLSVVSVVGSL